MSINILNQPLDYSSVNRQATLKWTDTYGSHLSKISININGQTFVTDFYPLGGIYECDLANLLRHFKTFENFTAYGLNQSNDIIDVTIDILVFYDDNGSPEVEDTTINKKFLNTVYQLEDNPFQYGDITYLHNSELTFFKGYPFNISLLLKQNSSIEYKINGGTNTQLGNYSGPKVTHWNFSNGLTSIDIDNGLNVLTVNNSLVDEPIDININVIDGACGLYLKWFNTAGGWDSFLFNPFYKDSEKDKNDVIIEVGEAIEVLTKSVERKLTIKASRLTKGQYKLVRGLTYAKKVLWFVNGKYIQVAIKSKNTHQTKSLHGELVFEVELPKRFLQ